MKKTKLLALIVFICSCSYNGLNDRLLNEVLESAGDNRQELEKVLSHYENNYLKYKAARFLIENMYGKYSIDDKSISQNNPYFDELEAYLNEYTSYGIQGLYIACDKVEKKQPYPNAQYILDAKTISADFLIKHIDYSFNVWENYPWCSDLDFKTFCQYILPYKTGNSYWEESNKYFTEKYGDMAISKSNFSIIEAFDYISTDIDTTFTQEGPFYANGYEFLLPTTFKNLVRTQLGQCLEYNHYKIMALRSMGIPSFLIKIPGWANYGHQHFWTEVLKMNTHKEIYDNIQRQYYMKRDEIIDCMFWTRKYISPDEGIPSFLPIQSCRTVPKVYQETYEIQKKSLALQATEPIPKYFMDPCLKDVTDEYIKTSNVKIKLTKNIDKKYAYLCCYDVGKWNPVDWGVIKNNSVTFNNIGVNILYLPVYYENKNIIPAGNPFILTEDGKINELYADGKSFTKEAILYSKTPYKTIEIHRASTMLNGRFQVANRSDLLDTVTVYTIEKTPYYEEKINLSLNELYRYGIYKFLDIDSLYYEFGIGGIEFWGESEDGKEFLLKGEYIGNQGTLANSIQAAFDDDRVTCFLYDPDKKERYIGLDFGKPYKLTCIKYYPRNDDNRVVPNEQYELYYWDKGCWISLGKKIGSKNSSLLYTNIPDNVLLRLHNHTRGKEYRPFTYQNNKQIWW